MKTPIFFIAAIVAFFVLPVDFTYMVSALFVAGFVAIAISDYRRVKPLPAQVPVAVRPRKQTLRLAA